MLFLNNIFINIKLFKTNFSNILKVVLSIFILLLIIGLAFDPEPYINSTFNGIIVFGSIVLPSLLPFFVLTRILTSLQVINSFCKFLTPVTKFLFKTPAVSSYIFVMSIISGYPVGAKLTSECYENRLITKLEAQKITSFTSNSGPMFIVGSVGVGMLASKQAGLIILLSHILASIFNGVLYRNFFTKTKKSEYDEKLIKKEVDLNKVFEQSVYSSANALLLIGSYIAIFFTFVQLLNNYLIFDSFVKLIYPILNILKLDPLIVKAVLEGMLEITKGCLTVANLGLNINLSTVCCTFIISFGGFCTYFQSLSFLNSCGIKKSFYLLQKLTHAIFSVVICLILINVFNIL
jgi:sporulation integral membrane protein YlbJ